MSMPDHPFRSVEDRFRLAPRQPLLIAAASGALGALALAALAATWDETAPMQRLLLGCAIILVAGLAVAAGWAAWRRPALLRVGPDGLFLPLPWRRPLPWDRIAAIRRERTPRRLFTEQDWLRISPAPDALPAYRWLTWRRLELWHMRRFGARLPISAFDAAPEEIIASIERFHPVDPAPPGAIR